jgi:hypothetical protein
LAAAAYASGLFFLHAEKQGGGFLRDLGSSPASKKKKCLERMEGCQVLRVADGIPAFCDTVKCFGFAIGNFTAEFAFPSDPIASLAKRDPEGRKPYDILSRGRQPLSVLPSTSHSIFSSPGTLHDMGMMIFGHPVADPEETEPLC